MAYIKIGKRLRKFGGTLHENIVKSKAVPETAYEIRSNDESLDSKVLVYYGNIMTLDDFKLVEDHIRSNPEYFGIYQFDELDELVYVYDDSYKYDITDVEHRRLTGDELAEFLKLKYTNSYIQDQLVDSKELERIRNTKRSDEDGNPELLQYEIDDKDDELVVLLKNVVNQLKLTMDEFYALSAWEDRGDAWNKLYGLRTRHSIDWDTLNLWMDALGLTYDITIRKAEVNEDLRERLSQPNPIQMDEE